MMRRLAQRVASLIVRPRRGAEAGAVAVQFAFLLLPLTILTFALVDLNRASSEKRRLQDALDAATLAAARSTAVTDAELQTIGAKTLTANLAAMSDATLLSSSFTTIKPKVIGTATAKLTPIVANLWMTGNMTVSASSEVVRSMNKVEVAMVLDTTGSMAGTKLSNLKTAAKNFVDTLSAAAARSTEVNPVKIGIVPFSSAVRVSADATQLTTWQTASWIDKGTAPISADIFNGKTGVNRFTLLSGMNQTWAGCVESRAMPYDVSDTAPSTGTPATLYTPYFWPDESDNDYSAINDYRLDGNYSSQGATGGSTTDWRRRQGYSGKYTGSPSGYGLGPNVGCDMQPLMRLTTDWTALKGRIDDLNAAGETHIPLGLAWGWNVLSPYGPFSDGVAYSTPKTTKIVVLMTDGENTYTTKNSNNDSNYDGYGFIWNNRMGSTSSNSGSRTDAIDARLSLLCSNMKAAGVVIYTVRVEVTTGSSDLLQGCASKPEFFYDVQSASSLNAVFSAIAGSIENLRISK
ncbi:MAG: pilus assembly protein TadG [Caulobacteraceae bacterium]|nr:pilus assembly protein TadG [Caulobacteraceae bacterium]